MREDAVRREMHPASPPREGDEGVPDTVRRLAEDRE